MPTDVRCPTFVHDAIVATAVDFARGTWFISASGDDGEVKGRCRTCRQVLTYALGDWRDAPTLPAAGRLIRSNETTDKETT